MFYFIFKRKEPQKTGLCMYAPVGLKAKPIACNE